MSYDITYEILNYEKYHKRLDDIVNNPQNVFAIKKSAPIGYTKCGFPIEHYKLGNGKIHVVFMGGCHGNEIITVDYITQLMKNMALGLGNFSSFPDDLFTIDFIPCQNPEGFFTTTYALSSLTQNMSTEEIEKFSKEYYSLYKKDDLNALVIHKIILSFSEYYKIPFNDINSAFWQHFHNKEISLNDILNFLSQYHKLSDNLQKLLISFWLEKLERNYIIPSYKYHNAFFNNVSLNCIPTFDLPHKRLKQNLQTLYASGEFQLNTLPKFFANSSGVNLNDNNEIYFNYLKKRMEEEKEIFATLRDNNLKKHIVGPIGSPNEDMNGTFQYTEENIALLKFLEAQEDDNFCFINCHSCGGMLFLYPVIDEELNKPTDRNFLFYINNRLGTEYTKATGDVYKNFTGMHKAYKMQGFPDQITGVGDVLRRKYIASFLLELSFAGGNPIGPYCDIEGNYKLTMLSNFNATKSLLDTILEVKHLYSTTYSIEYNNGKVSYKIN